MNCFKTLQFLYSYMKDVLFIMMVREFAGLTHYQTYWFDACALVAYLLRFVVLAVV